jgi:hypothetical protein
LNGVVGEVDEVVVDILGRKGLGRGADVCLFEKVNGEVIGQQDPRSDVELAVVDQERSFDVFLDHKGAGVELELFTKERFLCDWSGVSLNELLTHRHSLRLSDVPGLLLFLCVLIIFLLVEFFPVHHGQKIQQFFFQLLERVEYFDSPASVEPCGFQQPHVAIFAIVGGVVDGPAQQIDLFLDVGVLATHVVLHLADKSIRPVLLGIFPGVVFLEK